MIEILIKWLPLLSVIMILMGIIKFYTYYKIFNISIFSYIDLAEIPMLFMDNLLGYLFVVVPSLLFTVSLYENIFHVLPNFSDSPFLERRGFYFHGFYFSHYFFIIGMLVSAGLVYFRKNVRKYEFLLHLGLLFSCGYVFPIASIELKLFVSHHFYYNTGLMQSTLVISTIFLGGFSFLSAWNEARKVKKFKYFAKSTFEFESEGLLSKVIGEDFYYIGRTKSFLFFHDSIRKSTEVIESKKFKKAVMNFNKP